MAYRAGHPRPAMEPRPVKSDERLAICLANLCFSQGIAMGPANDFFAPAKAGEPLEFSGRDMSSSEITACLTPAEGYRLWANTYDNECNPMLSLEQRILEPLLPSLAGLDVIDLGCGTGRWLNTLKDKKARSLLGVDFSPEMLRVAQSKLDSAANIECADCENASLQNSSADLI